MLFVPEHCESPLCAFRQPKRRSGHGAWYGPLPKVAVLYARKGRSGRFP